MDISFVVINSFSKKLFITNPTLKTDSAASNEGKGKLTSYVMYTIITQQTHWLAIAHCLITMRGMGNKAYKSCSSFGLVLRQD
jgi:hypothetical protein